MMPVEAQQMLQLTKKLEKRNNVIHYIPRHDCQFSSLAATHFLVN